MKQTWSKRCPFCGEYVSGIGQMPEFDAGWMCGFCRMEEQEHAEHVVSVQPVGARMCHYVVVDLDIDRGHT